jgi:hypothetical protein
MSQLTWNDARRSPSTNRKRTGAVSHHTNTMPSVRARRHNVPRFTQAPRRLPQGIDMAVAASVDPECLTLLLGTVDGTDLKNRFHRTGSHTSARPPKEWYSSGTTSQINTPPT